MSVTDEKISVGERVISGTLWMGAWRWTARLIGIISTIILARLLLPGDFGIVATGMIVVAFFDILIDLGTDKYLIRLPDPDNEDYNTAWTLRMLVVLAASATIFLLAKPFAGYFEESRLVEVLQVLALASFLRGFSNIGLVMYKRELRFKKIALIGLSQRVVGSATTILLAFILQNYWAMVIGEIVLRLAELVLSYLIHPYRPRLSISRFANQWDFCQWIVVRNIASFLQGQGDNLVVAKYFGIELIGVYTMAMRFASLPTTQLVAPMIAPIYSGLAKKQGEHEILIANVLHVVGASTTIVLPLAVLFSGLGEPLVLALLGDKWQPAVPLVGPLIFSLVVAVLIHPAISTLTLLGKVRLVAGLQWISAGSLIGIMLFTAQFDDLELMATARLLLALAFLLLYYHWIIAALGFTWLQLMNTVYRPMLAGAAMALLIESITSLSMGPWSIITLGIVAGGIIYTFTLYVLWRVASSPESGEAMLVRKFFKVIGRRFTLVSR